VWEERGDTLLQQVAACLRAKKLKKWEDQCVVFPFYPLQYQRESYTFFDFTRDFIKYFHWFQQLKSNTCISITPVSNAFSTEDYLANMSLVYKNIALRNEVSGGFLVHGIMVVSEKKAMIFAGDSGAGKTTTARRLPSDKWQLYSDDLTLVVKGKDGNYYAYPWPGEKAYRHHELRYNSSQGILLETIFFIVQNKEVSLMRLPAIKTIAMLQRVTSQAMDLPDPSVNPALVGEMRKNRLKNLSDFVQKVPCYELSLNMIDPFWETIEEVLL
jgi:SynChlorMet cassette protein ScmC